jgi:hypothetical protein
MPHRWFALVLPLMTAALWWGEATAQASWSEAVRGDAAIITLDVLPLQAEVRLDGVLLGTASQLTAQVVTISPGRHVVEVSAPGHHPSNTAFYSTRNWVNHVQVQLIPARLR